MTLVEQVAPGVDGVDKVDKVRVHVKTYQGVDVFVTTKGRWEATYSKDGGKPQVHSRGSLDDIEADIHKTGAGRYTGRVEVRYIPPNPVRLSDVQSLNKEVETGSVYGAWSTRNAVVVITGVARRERDRRTGEGGRLDFQTTTGIVSMSDSWSPPDEALDDILRGLIAQYASDQHNWHERFDALLVQYPRLNAEDIVRLLEQQGAKV